MPPRSEEWFPMPASPPHGEDFTPFTACDESLVYAFWAEMTEPDADRAGTAIEAQAGMIPPAIPWRGSENRSNQDKDARTRRSMKAV